MFSRLTFLGPRLAAAAAILTTAVGCDGHPATNADCAKPGACLETDTPPRTVEVPVPGPTVTVTVTATPAVPTPKPAPKASPRPVVWPVCKPSQLQVFLTSNRTHYSVRQPVVFTKTVVNRSGSGCDTLDNFQTELLSRVFVKDADDQVTWPTGPPGILAMAGTFRKHWAAHSAQTFDVVWSQCTCSGVFVGGAYPSEDERAAPGDYYATTEVTLAPSRHGGTFVHSAELDFILDP